jgi:hypothetical protein
MAFPSIKTLNATISNTILFTYLACKTINTIPFKVSPLVYCGISFLMIVFLKFLFSSLRKFWKTRFRLIWQVIHNLHFGAVFYYILWITNSIILSDLFVRCLFSSFIPCWCIVFYHYCFTRVLEKTTLKNLQLRKNLFKKTFQFFREISKKA